MRGLELASRVLVLCLAGALGCSLMVDTSDLDAGCPEGQRLCDGRCVDDTDPAYGCTPGVCGAPCTKPNGIPECVSGVCVLKHCRYGFGCGGCDVDVLMNENHCGSCHNECTRGKRCVNGECVEQPTTTSAPSAG